ncbi:MAG: hypothetical protein DWQ02_14895 [Bacteroidetes bacterium]|nr:MAG: hypothetical protein DWQ02_14895 [Bacteroidota bacterium]
MKECTPLAGSDQPGKVDFSCSDPGVDSMLDEDPPPILSQKVYTFQLKTDPASGVHQRFNQKTSHCFGKECIENC